MERIVNVGIIGCGGIAGGKHMPSLKKVPNVRMVAFCDIIREKAEKIGAIVAMPYKIGSCRGGAEWNDVYNIIKQVFDKSNVDVEIWKYDLG